MNKTLLAFTLLLSLTFSLTSLSEWELIDSHSKGDYYVDTDDIRRSGNIIRYFELITSPNNDDIKSAIDFKEGNCFDMTTKIMQRTYFSDLNATKIYGESDKSYKTIYHRKGTVGYFILDKVCKH